MEIPSVVIDRLPLYARALARLDSDGREVVSSQELGNHLNVTPAQIRKDLSYFGRFGKQGRGYNVRKLLDELRRILGLNRQWRIAIVGAGRLGKAIAGYEGFTPQGFRIVEAFDSDPEMIGNTINSLVIKNTESLETVLRDSPVDIGIVAVPAESAQKVIDALVRCGVRAILNYAPIAAHVPPGVQIKRIDPVLALQGMTYHLKADASSPS
ncbi:MAG: redox-sensing transcriptional repressor Rex [Dehalococcoidia bacterium]